MDNSLIRHKAEFWNLYDDNKLIQCTLCPRKCIIKPDKRGFCQARLNVNGILYTLVYGNPAALQIDPIEKKPMAEFLSGTWTFSIGTYGCNLDCLFCQNYHLSRGKPEISIPKGKYYSPENLIQKAIETECSSIAFTYNEPTVWAEYAIDIAKEASRNNLKVVLVSNGYITKAAAETLYPLVDAVNIDMKGFSEEFYSEMTNGSMRYVLDSIKYLYSLKKHIELTNLIISGKNDDEKIINSYLDWVDINLNKNIPLHFSAFYPCHKYKVSKSTSPSTLYHIREQANERGFHHVYLGNI
ncbi:MAG TPA: AmmeMemoRadiSam system radical SAM enzyme [Victivallales bacterium]|nr:AmmeMemoRadiSam system radical SAM enzyme [Victivallales bacterium]